MVKHIVKIGISVFFTLILSALGFSQGTEQITITTYYPSPYGSYRELRAQRMAIGETYFSNNTVCWAGPDATCLKPIPATNDMDLLVEGHVGIGTDDTNYLRSSDRVLKVVGQVELGTDGTPIMKHTAVFADSFSGYGIALGGLHHTVVGTPGIYSSHIQSFKYDSSTDDFDVTVPLILAGSPVSIGTDEPDLSYALYVTGAVGKGKVYARDGFFTGAGVNCCADYVFGSNYDLESIEEHAAYMWKNKHLKSVPEMTKDKDGKDVVELGALNNGILEELEKAHIYIEQLNEQIKDLKAEINSVKANVKNN